MPLLGHHIVVYFPTLGRAKAPLSERNRTHVLRASVNCCRRRQGSYLDAVVQFHSDERFHFLALAMLDSIVFIEIINDFDFIRLI